MADNQASRSDRILFVDDDANALQAFRRSLRKDFDLEVAASAREGIQTIRDRGPCAVVVSDMRMPEIDGLQFLQMVRRLAPDTVRVMLTGNNDQETAVNAVNQGEVFRFLTKPCDGETLRLVLRRALEQYRLVTAERELLEETLQGSVRLLTDLIGMLDPVQAPERQTMQRLAKALAVDLSIEPAWEVPVAAMLCRIGMITLPPEVVLRVRRGKDLHDYEQEMLAGVPGTSADLVGRIPRLQGVAEIIRHQERRPDEDRDALSRGARVLQMLTDYTAQRRAGLEPGDACRYLRRRPDLYDEEALDALERHAVRLDGEGAAGAGAVRDLTVRGLAVGDLLLTDIQDADGQVLVSAGNTITPTLQKRIINLSRIKDITPNVKARRGG